MTISPLTTSPRITSTQTQAAPAPMEERDEGSTTTAPPPRQDKEQLDEPQQKPGTETKHDDATDPTQAIANAPRFLGEQQPLPEELQLLEDFQRLLNESHVELPRSFWEANYNESRCSLFWRFLVANEDHLARAKEQLTRDIAWREEIKLHELSTLTRQQIVGVDDAFFLEQYPCVCLGYEDAADNYAPVVYRSLTHLQTKVLAAKGVSVDEMVKHELWQYETDCKRLFSYPESFPARQLKVIIDIYGMTWGQCTKDLVSILSGFSSFSKLHHPERLQKLFIIGAPKPFSFVWNTIISHIIPVSTKEKITILHSFEGHPWLEAWMDKLPAAMDDAKAKAEAASTGAK